MRTMKIFAGALLTLTLLASLPAISHAGGGGFGGGPLANVFLSDCYKMVSGSNVPYTMDVEDQFGQHQSIKVGHSQFVCVVSGAWTRTPGSNSPALNEAFDPAASNAAKCYDVVSPSDPAPGTVGTVVDIFATETAVLQKMSMLCTPATLGE
jgi:hypothetical protein